MKRDPMDYVPGLSHAEAGLLLRMRSGLRVVRCRRAKFRNNLPLWTSTEGELDGTLCEGLREKRCVMPLGKGHTPYRISALGELALMKLERTPPCPT